MKVAVLMSTYNGASYLQEQLNSIANQTIVNDVTLYIRDDGSDDNTFDIIETFRDRINIVLYKGDNVGPGKSFWELLINPDIQADFYAFADQDDIWDADKLESAIYTLGQEYQLYMCNCRLINDENTVIQELFRESIPVMTIPRQCICGIGQGCAMVFSDALRKRIMESDITCIPIHDSIVMLYALGFGKVYYDIKPHFSYRMHEGNVVAKSGKKHIRRIFSSIKIWKSNAKNSMSDVAKEMLANHVVTDEASKDYLENLAMYKKSFSAKRKILNYEAVEGITQQALRSYRMRVWLNLF